MRYTEQELRCFIIQDLIADIRCADRDGLPKYAAECRRELAKLWPQRHKAKLDCYGWPSQTLDKD